MNHTECNFKYKPVCEIVLVLICTVTYFDHRHGYCLFFHLSLPMTHFFQQRDYCCLNIKKKKYMVFYTVLSYLHHSSAAHYVPQSNLEMRVYSKGCCPNKGRCTLLTFRPTSDLFRCGLDLKTLRTKYGVFKFKVEHQGI